MSTPETQFRVFTEDYTELSNHVSRQWTVGGGNGDGGVSLTWMGGAVIRAAAWGLLITVAVTVVLCGLFAVFGIIPWPWGFPVGLIAGVVTYARLSSSADGGIGLEQRLRLALNYRRKQPKALSGLREYSEPTTVTWVLILWHPQFDDERWNTRTAR